MVTNSQITINNESGSSIVLKVYGVEHTVPASGSINVPVQKQIF
jgi:hypothetical protein